MLKNTVEQTCLTVPNDAIELSVKELDNVNGAWCNNWGGWGDWGWGGWDCCGWDNWGGCGSGGWGGCGSGGWGGGWGGGFGKRGFKNHGGHNKR